MNAQLSKDLPKNLHKNLLSMTIEDKSVLDAAYMPFLQKGGLFVPTRQQFAFGDEVFVHLRLPQLSEDVPLAGKVVWITPNRASNGRQAGIGVQFTDRDAEQRQRIERLLADFEPTPGSSNTYTL